MKNRFPILIKKLAYPFMVQVQLVRALCCLHNIIWIIGGDDIFDEEWDENYDDRNEDNDNMDDPRVSSKAITTAQVNQAKAIRENIATKMWSQYIRHQDS